MNRTKIKNYAPRARRDFIQAVTDRAAFFGLTAKKTEPIVEQGDLAIIGGRPFPKAVAGKRKRLEERIKRDGFEQTMEALAYTWFNRLVAIRYMELHGYLDHGYRVLSAQGETIDGANGIAASSAKSMTQTPEILAHAEHLDLPGLDRQTVIDLKLAGDKEAELYRMLLVAQCNALHAAMPFLFERIDDETELVLPENLLHSDSLIRKLVGEIDEQDWQEVEIIGWIYQFYISEKKDQVIGKVVKSEDIPAATQLFTPNWIVKYLVQNSLGRQWLEHHPDSPLKGQMEYYIEPAEQTPEVQAELQEIIRKRALENRRLTTDDTDNTDENHNPDLSSSVPSVRSVVDLSLNPERLTLLDPACGSGHILVEAYDLFKAIYQERGYNRREIPRLILEKNLYGLEIDDRAAQLASLALMMKARADDRRIFGRGVKPNVVAFQESKGLDANEITEALNQPILKEDLPPSGELFEEIADEKSPLFSRQNLAVKGDISQADVAQLIDLFEHAKTFGSLIQVPEPLTAKLSAIVQRIADVLGHGGMFGQAEARVMRPFVEQAQALSRKYEAVVTNPPYMGTKGQNILLKEFLRTHFHQVKPDTFSAFIIRNGAFAPATGRLALMCPFVWMFIGSYQGLRHLLISQKQIESLIQLEYSGFEGATVPICAFTYTNWHSPGYVASFIKLSDFRGPAQQSPRVLEAIRTPQCGWLFHAAPDTFDAIAGSPIAYWSSGAVREGFRTMPPLSGYADTRIGLITGDNDRYMREWWEVALDSIGFNLSRAKAACSGNRWFPVVKGGGFRKWYGNMSQVVDWRSDGKELQTRLHSSGTRTLAHNFNLDRLFQEGVNWSKVTSSTFSARLQPAGCIFADPSASAFPKERRWQVWLLAFLSSKVPDYLLRNINPTLNYQPGNIDILPFAIDAMTEHNSELHVLCNDATEIAKADWDSSETSWDFVSFELCENISNSNAFTVGDSFRTWNIVCTERHGKLARLEELNNKIFIAAYGLQDELSPEVPEDQITLYRPDREEDIKRLISYAIGCMMGRYSLDKPGLIYAHSGNVGFDPSQYVTFPADDDGLVPLLESDWGITDDAANRLVEFINVCWPGSSTTDNTDSTDDQTPSDTPSSVPSVESVVKTSPFLEENLQFIAESLGPTRSEQPRDTIRRYLATGFYKHHLSMYKRRPIYWLFTSGKLRAFQCLVYLHRYNDGTLSRMRTEYVIPLQGKLAARADQLATEITAATSTSHRKKLEKERDKLIKQQVELQTFDEKLRHYADQRITLDLDDGVKVNYAKFGDLLADVKAVTGSKVEE